jgi:hypothetical protein
MGITAAQAQAELDRRAKAKPAGITAAQAQAELDRRATMDTDWGPRGLGDNFARAGQSLDDSMRLIADTATRGYFDKMLGPEEQAKTAAARERQGWGGTALDVGAAVATSPYRIGSMAGGALAGGLEGAASAYGHQEGWVPGWDVLKGAGTGIVAGAGGAKLGEWAGRGWNRMFGEAPPPMPAPTGEPKMGRIGTAVHSASKVPLTTTVPIDLALAHFGVPPVVSGTAKTARLVRPLFKPQLPPAARPPEPAAAAAARDMLAKMMIGYGRSP